MEGDLRLEGGLHQEVGGHHHHLDLEGGHPQGLEEGQLAGVALWAGGGLGRAWTRGAAPTAGGSTVLQQSAAADSRHTAAL